jgi:hypothetical protein
VKRGNNPYLFSIYIFVSWGLVIHSHMRGAAERGAEEGSRHVGQKEPALKACIWVLILFRSPKPFAQLSFF